MFLKDNRIAIAIIYSWLVVTSCHAKITLPHVLADHMVLQRNAKVTLWGWASPNQKIKISTSWNQDETIVTANSEGSWEVKVPTIGAGGPYEIAFDDGEVLVLKDILLGEVWFCSGQSNMEMPLSGFKGQPVFGSNDVIAQAKSTIPIRMFTSVNSSSKVAQKDVEGTWMLHTPQGVSQCSATAYYYARYLQNVLDVPVGIIISSWGGTRIEAWMNSETIQAIGLTDSIPKGHGYNGIGNLFNGKLWPLSNFTIRGFLWYQGESNVNNAHQYERLFPAFIKMLRNLWGNEELPFYFVQIAPYQGNTSKEDDKYARLREAQFKTSQQLFNTGMVVSLDVGSQYCIHPPDKITVANRLAYWALSETYGVSGIGYKAPEYSDTKFENDKAYIRFNFFSSTCLGPSEVALQHFEIAGNDGIFYPAEAVIDQRSCQEIIVSSKKVPSPVKVRYAFHNFVVGEVYDDSGLPISSFRTDSD